jgi:ABC-2 type transport system ATP-binding protein
VPDRLFNDTLDRLTALLEVGQVIRQPARSLSLGERMRCEFIMSMLHSPSVVFLDEPTIGLDALGKEAIHGFIREMNRAGVTFILTTHDLGDIERLARRVIVINQGLIVFDDALEALRRYFGTRKKIRLVTEDAVDGLEVPGLTETGRRSATDADFELDLSRLPVEAFMSRVSTIRRVRDISIEEIPIETVIKELYAQGREK